jgi:transposase
MQLYCGIDLHSNNSLVSVINDNDTVVQEKRLDNDLTKITELLAPYQTDLTGIVVESTYNWYWLVDGLMDEGYPVHLANTLAIQQYSGLKYTNDSTDARHLAHLLRLGILPTGYIYPKAFRAIRDLLRRRLLLVKQRTAHHLSLQSMISRHTGQRLNANKIKHLTEAELKEYFSTDAAQLTGLTEWYMMQELTQQISTIENFVLKECQRDELFSILTSIPGVGKILAMTILLETGPIERFPCVGNYSSYARCAPSDKVSNGKSKGKGNTKNGNRYLAMAFVEAAHYATIWNVEIKRAYQRRLKKSPTMVAKKAIANKLTRACYHMLKEKTMFDIKLAFG